MTHKTKTILKASAGLTTACLALLFILSLTANSRELSIRFFNAGNAVLIRTPFNQTILIAPEINNALVSSLGASLPFYIRDIDVLIIPTSPNPHTKAFGVGVNSSEQLRAHYTIKKTITLDDVSGGEEHIALGKNLSLEIQSAGSSLVLRLLYKNQSFLFTPDLDPKGETYLLTKKIDLRADVLGTGQLKSINSLRSEWLNAVNPSTLIIQSPAPHILRRLERNNITVYRTDDNGDIIIKTDGERIRVTHN